jgi:prevent-host-death family protein
MPITILSSRKFNRDAGRVKRAAKRGPVIITYRGRPAHVLLSIEDYRALTGGHRNIADALAMSGIADIAFEPPRVRIRTRAAEF